MYKKNIKNIFRLILFGMIVISTQVKSMQFDFYYDEDLNSLNRLFDAIEKDELETVKNIVEKEKINVHAKSTGEIKGIHRAYEGWEPIHYACKRARFEIVKYLISKGANPHVKTPSNAQPIHLLPYNYTNYTNNRAQLTFKILQYLIEKQNISIHTKNNVGDLPLHHACYEANLPIVKYLIKHGANLKALNNEGETPLHCVFKENIYNKENKQVARYLITQKISTIDLEAEDYKGYKPIHWAIERGDLDLVRLLIEKGNDFREIDASIIFDKKFFENFKLVKLILANIKKENVDLDYLVDQDNCNLITGLINNPQALTTIIDNDAEFYHKFFIPPKKYSNISRKYVYETLKRAKFFKCFDFLNNACNTYFIFRILCGIKKVKVERTYKNNNKKYKICCFKNCQSNLPSDIAAYILSYSQYFYYRNSQRVINKLCKKKLKKKRKKNFISS